MVVLRLIIIIGEEVKSLMAYLYVVVESFHISAFPALSKVSYMFAVFLCMLIHHIDKIGQAIFLFIPGHSSSLLDGLFGDLLQKRRGLYLRILIFIFNMLSSLVSSCFNFSLVKFGELLAPA